MIKYRTTFNDIESINIERETNNQVIFKSHGRTVRENKTSDWRNWHNTWGEARDFLVKGVSLEIQCLRKELEQAEMEIDRLKALQPDDRSEEE